MQAVGVVEDILDHLVVLAAPRIRVTVGQVVAGREGHKHSTAHHVLVVMVKVVEVEVEEHKGKDPSLTDKEDMVVMVVLF
jgi:hypothetical protein